MTTLKAMLEEMVAPGSRATRNERDAAASVLRSGLDVLSVPRHEAALLVAYYDRVHQQQMGSHLVAAGA